MNGAQFVFIPVLLHIVVDFLDCICVIYFLFLFDPLCHQRKFSHYLTGSAKHIEDPSSVQAYMLANLLTCYRFLLLIKHYQSFLLFKLVVSLFYLPPNFLVILYAVFVILFR